MPFRIQSAQVILVDNSEVAAGAQRRLFNQMLASRRQGYGLMWRWRRQIGINPSRTAVFVFHRHFQTAVMKDEKKNDILKWQLVERVHELMAKLLQI